MAADNGRTPGRTDRARELAAYIADQPDEITETQIHVHGGSVHVGETGRHRAVTPQQRPQGNEDITTPDNPRPPNGYPERVSRALAPLLGGLPPWGRVLVLLALIGVLGLAVWRGGAGLELWP